MSFNDILARKQNNSSNNYDVPDMTTNNNQTSFDRIISRNQIKKKKIELPDTQTVWQKILSNTGVVTQSDYQELEGLDAFVNKMKIFKDDVKEGIKDVPESLQKASNFLGDATYKGIEKVTDFEKSIENGISSGIIGIGQAINSDKMKQRQDLVKGKGATGGTANIIEKIANKFGYTTGMDTNITKNEINKIEEQQNKDTEYRQKLQAESSKSVAGEVGYNIGNMIPTIAAAQISPVTASQITYASTHGQTAGDKLAEGRSIEEADKIGIGAGVLEASLDRLVGGVANISGIGDKNAEKLISKVAKNNKFANFALSKIYEIGGENTEEQLTNIANNVWENIVTEENNTVFNKEESVKTAQITTLSTIVLGFLGLGGNTYNNVKETDINNAINEISKESNITDNDKQKIKEIVTNQVTSQNNIQVENSTKETTTSVKEIVPTEIQKENTTVEHTADNAQEVSMRAKAEKYLNRSKNKFVNELVSNLQTTKYGNKDNLNELVSKITEKYNKDGKITSEEKDSIFEEVYSSLQKMDNDYYNEYKDLKEELKNTTLFVDDSIKNDINDFDYVRKSNLGIIKLSNDSKSIDIDSKYQELSDRYPSLFPDNIYNKAEQLQKIIDVANDIKISKTNVQAYIDENLGPEYELWAKEEFSKGLDNFVSDISKANRYNEDVKIQQDSNIKKDEIKEVYKYIDQYKKIYEKTSSEELLTTKDKIQVDRLLNNEISTDEIPKDCNKEGIIKVYKSKLQYDTLQKSINEYNQKIKEDRLNQAIKDIGDVDQWKDKKAGFLYSRETAERNIYDIAPKQVADTINKNYIQTYKKNETIATKVINNLNEQIKSLRLGDSKNYEISYTTTDRETGNPKTIDAKLSESALVQLFGEKRITLEQLQKSGANVDKITNSVEKFRKIYNTLINQANEVLLDNGYAPIQYRKDYFPHFTQETTDSALGKIAKLVGIDVSNQELPTDIAGQTHNFKPGKRWIGNLLQRTTDITDFDAKKGFDMYLNGITDIIFHTEDIKKFRALESAIRGKYNTEQIEEKVNAIKDNKNLTSEEKIVEINSIYDEVKDKSHLSHFVTWLQDYTNILAGKKSMADRHLEHEFGRNMYKTMQNVENKIAANMVGGNIGVSVSNFAVLAQATGEVKTLNLVQGMWDTMKNGIIRDNSFVSESDFITRRRGTDKLSQTKTEKVVNTLTSPLEFVDKFSSEVVVRAKYLQNLQKGMTKQEALKEADQYATKLMADRSKGALPTIFYNKNPIAKLTTMFQVEVNNQWSHYLKDMPRDLTKPQLAIGYTKIMVGSYLMNELIGSIRGKGTRLLPDPIYIVKEVIKQLTDDDDDNDGDAFINTGKEILGSIPFVSVPAALFGIDDIGRIPISGAIPDATKIAKSTADLVSSNSEGNPLKNIGSELAESLSYFALPVGAAQLKKTYQGLSMYNEDLLTPGSYNENGNLRFTADNSAWGRIQSALFGQYASDSAQEYIDSGFTSIDADNIGELSQLGMTSEEYKEYKKGLNECKSVSAKFEYIKKLDVPDRQKNIMLNNVSGGGTKDKNGYDKYIETDAVVYDSKGNIKCKIPGKSTIYWYDKDTNTLYNNSYKAVTGVNKSLLEQVKENNTYWYDSKTKTLYDTKYNVVENKNIKTLEKYEKTYDMNEYNQYDSFEEFDFAQNNQEEYKVINKICDYKDYSKYKTEIDKVKAKYKNTTEKKNAVFNYIENLPMSSGQKMMLFKTAGGYSLDKYQKEMYTYINDLQITKTEKTELWNTLYDK